MLKIGEFSKLSRISISIAAKVAAMKEGMDLTAPCPEVKLFFSDFVYNPAP